MRGNPGDRPPDPRSYRISDKKIKSPDPFPGGEARRIQLTQELAPHAAGKTGTSWTNRPPGFISMITKYLITMPGDLPARGNTVIAFENNPDINYITAIPPVFITSFPSLMFHHSDSYQR